MQNILTVLSYNIWFDEAMSLERTVSLLSAINRINPDVICLQEVKPDIYDILITLLSDYRYHYPKKINKEYGCVTFSKYQISKCTDYKFPNSKMGRSLIITKIEYPYHKITNDGISVETMSIIIANSHFESLFRRKSDNTEKLEQYKMTKDILNKLHETTNNVILCSDTNVMVHEENVLDECFDGWQDAWKLKGSNLNKYTYDSETNIYLNIRLKKFACRSRIDRIIYRTSDCVLEEFHMICGNKDGVEPSDHYGVYSKFNCASATHV
jgi:tyrosyl-DNA phosphodiesterase 2